MRRLYLVIALLLIACNAYAEQWVATGYCKCKICCEKEIWDKNYGITASGDKAKAEHTIAINWLPFGTKVMINKKLYMVEDRGAKNIFGDKKHHIKALDIYFNTHKEARKFGKRLVEVKILKEKG